MVLGSRQKPAVDISRDLSLSRKAQRLLSPGITVNGFVKALVQAAYWDDAIVFLTAAMMPRKAIWWGCLCARHSLGDKPPPAEQTALLAATRWVVSPSAEHRQQAEDAAKALAANSASGCVARAASLGGVARDAKATPVPERPRLPAQLVAAAIALAAAAAGPKRRQLLCRQYVFIGLNVANDDNRWK